MARMRFLIFLAALAAFIPSNVCLAQSKPHPAAEVASQYLRDIHLHEWEKAVKLVDKKSLANLKNFQERYLEAAPTIADEEELLRLLGLKTINDIRALTPEEVFIRRGQAKTKKLVDPEKHIEEMKASLKMNTLGAVPEGSDTVHVVIRKEFAGQGKKFSELAFVSLVNEEGKWKVSLDAQEPKIFDLKSGKLEE